MIEMTSWHEKINPCFPSLSLPAAATVLLTRNTMEDASGYVRDWLLLLLGDGQTRTLPRIPAVLNPHNG